MVEAWSGFFSIPGQRVRHRLSEVAGKFGVEVAGFAQERNVHARNQLQAGRFKYENLTSDSGVDRFDPES